MTYYEILGVEKDATKQQIKAAYRKLAQANHPDKGGDADLFVEIQRAYDTLMDPEKRDHYDRYGVAMPTSTTLTKAREMVAGLFQQAMSGEVSNTTDIIGLMKENLEDQKSGIRGNLRRISGERRKNHTVRKRLSSRTGDEMLHEIINARRNDLWRAYRTIQAMLNVCEVATGLLEGYDYKVDIELPRYGQHEWAGWPAWSRP